MGLIDNRNSSSLLPIGIGELGTLYDIKVCASVSPREKRDIGMHPPKNVLKLEVRKNKFRA